MMNSLYSDFKATVYPRAAMMVNNGDSEGLVEEAGRGFLGHLTPAVVPHCPYQGRDQFLDDFKHAEIPLARITSGY
jgi:hypothetical protein